MNYRRRKPIDLNLNWLFLLLLLLSRLGSTSIVQMVLKDEFGKSSVLERCSAKGTLANEAVGAMRDRNRTPIPVGDINFVRLGSINLRESLI